MIPKWIVLFWMIFILSYVFQSIGYTQGRGKIYWSEDRYIKRANLNGTAIETVLEKPFTSRDITLDLHNRKIYWIDNPVNFLQNPVNLIVKRANLDGSNTEVVINPGEMIAVPGKRRYFPFTITLDTNANKIYWGNVNGPWGITRADYDGSNIEDIRIIPPGGAVFGKTIDAESIELDVKSNKIYWADSFNDGIGRANYDGSNYEQLINLPGPLGLALDLNNRKMYWTDGILNIIERSSLNGNNIETLVTELKFPYDIVLDVRSDKMYWLELEGKGGIKRANLDGSNVTEILTDIENIGWIALDLHNIYDVSSTNRLTTIWANVKNQ